MAYESLKQEIRKYIKTNGQNEITGQILQDVLIDMVNQYPSLDGYATQQWVENQGYISEADLTNYATQSWVSSNYATLSAVNELSYINGVTSDGLGRLTLTGHNFEATVLDFSHQHRWEELIDVPTNLRDLGITEEYLPLSGGNMTGDLTFASGNGISVYYQYGDPSDPEYDAILIENGVISVGNGGDITIGGNSVATQSWVQQQGYLTSAPVTSVAGYTGAVTVANLATALSLSNYATETWVTNQGYITSSGSCAYATSAGSAKILNGNVVQGSTSLADGDVLVYDSGAWYNTPRATYLSGYATLSAINALSYINGVTSDGLGRLTLTGPNFPATVLDLSHQHRWEELIDVPTNLRDLGITEEYLPLSGGTLSGTLTMSDDIMISGSNSIFFDIDNNIYADIYGSNSSRLYITGYDGIRLLISNPNQVTHAYLDITDSGVNINGDIVATQSWVQQQGYLTSAPVTSVAGYTGSVTVANLATALSLSNYATEMWVTNQGYITSSGSCAYATSAGSAKILNGNVVQGSTSLADGDVLVYDSGAWYNTPRATYLGGYATQSWVSSNYATLSAVNGLSYINGVTSDGLGRLTLTGHNFEATVLDFSHQHRWEELIDVPTNLRDLGITEEYLPLSGGTLSGTLTMSDDIMISGSNSIFFDIDNNIYADTYGSNSSRLYITGYDGIRLLISNPNQVTHAYLDITDSGVNINGDIVATQSWVQQQGYLTSAPVTSVAGYTGSVTVANLATALSLSNYATETWVTNQGYITSSGSCAYATSAGSAKILNGNVVQGSTSLADGDVLVYDSGAWYNTPRATYLSGYATQSWVSSNYATQSTVNGLSYINGVALNGDGSLSLTGHSFATTILDMTHQHRWEELTDRPLIDMWNDTMVAVNGIVSSGKIGAGVSATPSYMLEVVGQAMIYSNVGIGTSPASGISLDIDGTARANSFVNSSDIRKKDVIEYDVDPGFETVANAPTIRFTWKDRGMLDNRGECVGSIAQYWQRALPEAVMTDSEGYLSMQYDVIALIAAVSVAKRVASHEQRIAALERENALLRMDIKALKGEA